MDYPKGVPNAGLVGGKFVDEDAIAGTIGSIIPSSWGNAVTDEIIAVIREAGLSPDEDDAAQMVRAIRLLQQGQVGGYAADSGIANAYAATYTPDVTALTDGMVLRLKAANTNTGPSTFAPNGLEAKPIVNMKYAALAAGDIQEGGEIWLQYNSSVPGGAWVSILSLGISDASTTVKGIVELATSTETQGGTDAAKAVTPAGLASVLSGKQNADATLSALAALAVAANKLIYATGADTFATTDLTAFARTLLDDADAAAARATLGAPAGVDKQICTAWVNFNGTGTVAIKDSHNISSVTDIGVGKYQINFSSAMVNENYAYAIGACDDDTVGDTVTGIPGIASKTTSSLKVVSLTANLVSFDSPDYCVSFFGGK